MIEIQSVVWPDEQELHRVGLVSQVIVPQPPFRVIPCEAVTRPCGHRLRFASKSNILLISIEIALIWHIRSEIKNRSLLEHIVLDSYFSY